MKSCVNTINTLRLHLRRSIKIKFCSWHMKKLFYPYLNIIFLKNGNNSHPFVKKLLNFFLKYIIHINNLFLIKRIKFKFRYHAPFRNNRTTRNRQNNSFFVFPGQQWTPCWRKMELFTALSPVRHFLQIQTTPAPAAPVIYYKKVKCKDTLKNEH